ncbi:M20/M25/M40 family metallo-hydrolase [Natronospirillum operosum]|uniref:M20/M25/M40 family metallo-hydrolase n=1 Tax=Natronospirillum operosum TaxID=2759953 RepID=A0A4Z0W8G2_9GAMM|nr:M20/M25/M40 family metallo-hydrolase [Natronospirillum operosum]TGG91338.1 M20/M25/M40 family metallo-hydrolase [Natronospirillum operosum]
MIKPDAQRLLKTLHELLLIDSPVGATAAIETDMMRRLAAFPVAVEQGARGNVLATWGEGPPRRAIAAHVDTLGAMVQSVRANGRPELTPLGTWSARFAEGARATVRTVHGEVRGTILPLLASGHAWNDGVDQQPVGWQQVELRLDAPVATREDAVALGIQPGDIVCIDPQPEFLPNGYVVSRFLDNKAALACVLEALHGLQEAGITPAVPACFAFTNAEETGHGAGNMLPRSVEDLISVDIAPVASNQASDEQRATLGFKDASGPHSLTLLTQLEELAAGQNIPVVRDVFRHYHSDCSSVMKAGYDTRTALVGFGTDSTHGHERTHLNSLLAVTALLTAWLCSA